MKLLNPDNKMTKYLVKDQRPGLNWNIACIYIFFLNATYDSLNLNV